jgi:hypothetical protein
VRLEIKGRGKVLACRLGVHMVNLDLPVRAEGMSFGQMRRKGLKVGKLVRGVIGHCIGNVE